MGRDVAVNVHSKREHINHFLPQIQLFFRAFHLRFNAQIKLCRSHVQVWTCGNQSQLFFHRLIALKRANSSDAFFRVTAYSVLLSFRQADTLVFLQSNVTDASSVPADINGIFSDISIAVDFGKCVPKDIQKTDVVCVLYGRTRQTSAGKHGFHKIRLLG